ncbi:hypothetical protein CRENBAI_018913 [Crenichthys baileyi]|uniref:Uncharacterized protein n=1 Tax=Crenichthys baileyi TaxID=28760 RepID=A0AAV9SRI5_9TELE
MSETMKVETDEPGGLSLEPSVPGMLVIKEEIFQDWNSSLDQQHPEPPYIKEEEELCMSREVEQLTVKIEDEKKPQLSELHQIETEDYSESKGLIISSTEQMEKELDVEDQNLTGTQILHVFLIKLS